MARRTRGTAAGMSQRESAARRNRNARPAQGQNLDVAQIAQTGRDQAAQNITFLGQQLGGLTDNFAGQQQRQIDAQQARLDNPFLAQAQGIVRNELGRTYGSPELEAQMRAVGASAMNYRPDQIVAPTDVRNVSAVNAAAAQAALTQGQAASAGYVAGPQAALGQAALADRIAGPQATFGQAATAGITNINADRVSAAQMSGVRDVEASRIRSGALGQSLMNRAIRGVEDGGRLNAEASRDAVQAARQGMAARGLATGGAAMAAELLNRDRYSRQREAQDLQFASGVQAADQVRRTANSQNIMDAQRLNQAADITQNQTNAGFIQQANLANQDAGLRAAQLNQSGAQFDAGNQQAMNLANMSAANQMALAGYQGDMNQSQFNTGNQQAMNLANLQNRQAANMAAYQGDINQGQFNAGNQQAINLANMSAANAMSQFNAGNQQAANLANQQAAMDAQRLNQARDVSLGQMSLDAQARNQAANMEATNMNRNYLGQSAQQLLNNDMMRSQNQVALGSQLLGYDPYRQAIEPGLAIGQPAMGAAGNFIGNNLTGMTDLAGNVSSFNTNRQDSLYNSWMNNQTALRVGQMQANAMNNAARMQANAMGSYGRASGGSMFGNVLGGMASGASAGAMTGNPWGMAGGAVLGGALSLFGR